MTEEKYGGFVKQTINGLVAPYLRKSYPQLILANRFDYTISSIKYLLPQALQDLKAICIMTASYGQGEGNYDWVYPQDLDPLNSLGIDFQLYDLKGKDEATVREDFEDVDLIITTGGDTFYLLKHMRACNFEAILKEKIEGGTIYLASSAGACVVGPDIDFIAPMDSPLKAGLTDFKALDIVPYRIVPHLNHPHLAGAAMVCLRDCIARGEQAIGLRDEQFMIVDGSAYQVF